MSVEADVSRVRGLSLLLNVERRALFVKNGPNDKLLAFNSKPVQGRIAGIHKNKIETELKLNRNISEFPVFK